MLILYLVEVLLITRRPAEKIGSGVGCKMVAAWWSEQHCVEWQPWESKLTIVVIVATPKLSQIPTIRQFAKNIPKQVQAISSRYLVVPYAGIIQNSEIQFSPKLVKLSL